MISRIRIDAVGFVASEVAAELEMASDHFRMACYFEGIIPQVSRVMEEVIEQVPYEGNFPYPVGTMQVKGRRIITFEIDENVLNSSSGGLAQYGYRVDTNHDHIPAEALVPEGVSREGDPIEDVTEKVFVLGRARPITRQHEWE